jgi:hypothetical protein
MLLAAWKKIFFRQPVTSLTFAYPVHYNIKVYLLKANFTACFRVGCWNRGLILSIPVVFTFYFVYSTLMADDRML